MTTRVEWTGREQVKKNIARYGERVREAVWTIALAYAPRIEAYAKDIAPWTDRTGNARQALHAFVEEVSRDAVAIYLAHGMEYGIYLETRWQGRYGVILDALEAFFGDIRASLQEIFD